ncbi:HEAT repeat [Alkalispirochaeta americana]|uniref:HEAT repeat n=1 Tax=Alkalispirochaeta americana TaxID=159291 RepID=A0A1N6P7K7_9SPIO|nr:HEAT repeat domain-containing protein [Alkalispirochaeta americana]SIQ00388.1 HEAT repeat [Alkalispirochaeta americana]
MIPSKNNTRPVTFPLTMTAWIVVVFMFLPVILLGEDFDEERQQKEEEAAPPTISQAEEWRETLRFGINSAVAELIPTLTSNREEELAPDVLAVFETSNDPAVLRSSVDYLRQLQIAGGEERGFQLIQEYYDRSSELITMVLGYLREIKAEPDQAVRDILIEISRMMPPSRAVAAIRYYATAEGTTIEDLIDLYQEPGLSEDAQGQVLVEIGTRGDVRAFDFVADILGDDEEATTVLQRFAIDTLGKLGDERAIPIILRQFSSPDSLTRAYAVNALTNFDTPETDQALLATLRDEFWRVRLAALKTVAERSMAEALPAVLFMVRRDPERPVRLEALQTAAALNDPQGWELLLNRLKDPRGNEEERGVIADLAIRKNLQDSMDVLKEVVQKEWERENSRILDRIGRSVSEGADRDLAPLVELLLNHPNPIIQVYGMRGVGESGLRQFAEVLTERRGEGNHPLVRRTAENALNKLGLD